MFLLKFTNQKWFFFIFAVFVPIANEKCDDENDDDALIKKKKMNKNCKCDHIHANASSVHRNAYLAIGA